MLLCHHFLHDVLINGPRNIWVVDLEDGVLANSVSSVLRLDIVLQAPHDVSEDNSIGSC